MGRNRLSSFWIMLMLVTGTGTVCGQKIPPQKPKLIVGITVSGMQYDYLSVYWDKFSDGGFRRMATSGANCKNARYNYLITDPSVGFASIATGTRPSEHGIVSDFWYRRFTNDIMNSIEDQEQTTIGGSYGTGTYSPWALHSRTLSDEMRVKSRFKSRSIGVSMDPNAAVLLAGHTACLLARSRACLLDQQFLLHGFTARLGRDI